MKQKRIMAILLGVSLALTGSAGSFSEYILAGENQAAVTGDEVSGTDESPEAVSADKNSASTADQQELSDTAVQQKNAEAEQQANSNEASQQEAVLNTTGQLAETAGQAAPETAAETITQEEVSDETSGQLQETVSQESITLQTTADAGVPEGSSDNTGNAANAGIDQGTENHINSDTADDFLNGQTGTGSNGETNTDKDGNTDEGTDENTQDDTGTGNHVLTEEELQAAADRNFLGIISSTAKKNDDGTFTVTIETAGNTYTKLYFGTEETPENFREEEIAEGTVSESGGCVISFDLPYEPAGQIISYVPGTADGVWYLEEDLYLRLPELEEEESQGQADGPSDTEDSTSGTSGNTDTDDTSGTSGSVNTDETSGTSGSVNTDETSDSSDDADAGSASGNEAGSSDSSSTSGSSGNGSGSSTSSGSGNSSSGSSSGSSSLSRKPGSSTSGSTSGSSSSSRKPGSSTSESSSSSRKPGSTSGSSSSSRKPGGSSSRGTVSSGKPGSGSGAGKSRHSSESTSSGTEDGTKSSTKSSTKKKNAAASTDISDAPEIDGLTCEAVYENENATLFRIYEYSDGYKLLEILLDGTDEENTAETEKNETLTDSTSPQASTQEPFSNTSTQESFSNTSTQETSPAASTQENDRKGHGTSGTGSIKDKPGKRGSAEDTAVDAEAEDVAADAVTEDTAVDAEAEDVAADAVTEDTAADVVTEDTSEVTITEDAKAEETVTEDTSHKDSAGGKNDEEALRYLLVPENAAVPENLDGDIIVIQLPATHLYTDEETVSEQLEQYGIDCEDMLIPGSSLYVKSYASSDVPDSADEIIQGMKLFGITVLVDRSADEVNEEAAAEWENVYRLLGAD